MRLTSCTSSKRPLKGAPLGERRVGRFTSTARPFSQDAPDRPFQNAGRFFFSSQSFNEVEERRS